MRHSGPPPGPPLEPDCPGVPVPSPVSLYPQQAGVGGCGGPCGCPWAVGAAAPHPTAWPHGGLLWGCLEQGAPNIPPSPPAMSGGSPHSAAAPPSQCLAVLLPLGPITRARAREHVSPGGQSQRRDPHSPARLSPALPGIGRLGGGQRSGPPLPPCSTRSGSWGPFGDAHPWGIWAGWGHEGMDAGMDVGMDRWRLGWRGAWTGGCWDGRAHG